MCTPSATIHAAHYRRIDTAHEALRQSWKSCCSSRKVMGGFLFEGVCQPPGGTTFCYCTPLNAKVWTNAGLYSPCGANAGPALNQLTNMKPCCCWADLLVGCTICWASPAQYVGDKCSDIPWSRNNLVNNDVRAACFVWSWPSKHEPFIQCCFNVGPASKTADQHWNCIGWMPRLCWGVPDAQLHWGDYSATCTWTFPVVTFLMGSVYTSPWLCW